MSRRHESGRVSTDGWAVAVGSDAVLRIQERFPDWWEGFVAAADGGSHLQTAAWASVQRRRGWKPYAVSVECDGHPVAAAMVIQRQLPRIGAVAYVAGGPVSAGSGDDIRVMAARSLQRLADELGVLVLLVEPAHGDSLMTGTLRAHRFVDTPFVVTLPATVRVDLAADDDQLMSNMKSKVRYNIRKGLRSGVEVRIGTDQDVPVLHRMVAATAERQGFGPPPIEHLRAMHDFEGPGGQARMFVAESEGRPLAAILTIAWGDTVVYKRGGWSGDGGEMHPNEVLHWAAMRWARDAGYRFYDFDGIERHLAELVLGGEPLPEDDRRSVSRFKLGFGGVPELRPPVLSYVRNPGLRWGYQRVLPALQSRGFLRHVEMS